MTIEVNFERHLPPDVDALVVGVHPDGIVEAGLEPRSAAARGFEGKVGQVVVDPGLPDGPLRVGLGLGPAGDLSTASLRRAGATLARSLSRVERVATTVVDRAVEAGLSRHEAVEAFAEGVNLGAYRFTTYLSDPGPARLRQVVVVGAGGARVQRSLETAGAIADAVCLARDLVNEPGGTLTPQVFAEAAVEVAEREDLQISVLDERDLAERGMGGLLGVNRGSLQPPRFVELCYEPDRPRGSLALVGKGITFDSGGLSIKTSDGMMTMKNDMAGAAAVLGAMSAVRTVGPKAAVRAYLPLTDNMIGGDATRPGDVLRISNGTTVEVLNTDAEGRLILADALAVASAAQPDAIVDLATLTGACEIALGKSVAGLMGNHPGWIEQVRGAAERTGERVWPLPLPEEYRRRLDSDVADLRNVTAARDGGALTAGLFLREFVGDGIAWAHLDIAGPSFAVADDGEIAKGGTGFGVRLLLELVRGFRRPG